MSGFGWLLAQSLNVSTTSASCKIIAYLDPESLETSFGFVKCFEDKPLSEWAVIKCLSENSGPDSVRTPLVFDLKRTGTDQCLTHGFCCLNNVLMRMEKTLQSHISVSESQSSETLRDWGEDATSFFVCDSHRALVQLVLGKARSILKHFTFL